MYRIVWTPTAESELAALWLAAPDRKAVTSAAHDIEQHLRIRPLLVGESRESSVNRVVVHPPLILLFDVIEDDKLVYIRYAGLTDPRL